MADLPVRVTGNSTPWARDLAIVTGATALLAPVLVWGWTSVTLFGTFFGLLSGGLLGAMAPGFLDRVRGRIPLAVLASLGFALGAVWGGVVGAVAAAAEVTILGTGTTILAAAGIGALQLGFFWLPYTVLTVLGQRTWPAVVASCAMAPILGGLVFALFL